MDKKLIEVQKEIIEDMLKDSNLSRRDAIKLMGIMSSTALMSPTSSQASANLNASSNKSARIVIVGGGAGGIMAAARLSSAASNAQITLIAPNEIHLYQPGQVFMAAGLYTQDDIIYHNKDRIPSGVKWVKDEVIEFNPDSNKVVTKSNGEIEYDFLVVATGLAYDYERIEGMSTDLVGQKGISSVYLNDPIAGTAKGGVVTWQWFKDLRAAAEKASPDNPVKAIYTQPQTPIKCGGAPQKILYLSDDALRGNSPLGGSDVHKNVQSFFCKKGTTLFGVPDYNDTLVNEVTPMYGNITDKFGHILKKIDPDKKIATFDHKYSVKGEYDKDLDEYDMISKTEEVELPYDFIHIVPPMKPVDAVANSPLGWDKGNAKGWLAVDRYTLQHMKYKNVFGIGDICGTPKGKTGGTARHHGPILQENLIAAMEGKEPTAKFDGYTVCPLKTQYGKIMLAEFDYQGKAPSVPFLDPKEPRWLWWAFDLYALKPMYWQLMMRGLM